MDPLRLPVGIDKGEEGMDMPSGPVVVLTRESRDNLELAQALLKRGVLVREIPCISTRYVMPRRLPEAKIDVVTFSSRRGVRGMLELDLAGRLIPEESRPLVAAVGKATAKELESAGIRVDLVADPPTGTVLAQRIMAEIEPPASVAAVRGDLRAGGMDAALEAAGFWVEPVIVYENVGPDIPRLEPSPVAAVFVASPSAARRLVDKNPWIKAAHFCAIGPTTAAALSELGVGSIEDVGTNMDVQVEALYGAHRRAVESERP
jgi:uroporphyrinogen-III synthase